MSARPTPSRRIKLLGGLSVLGLALGSVAALDPAVPAPRLIAQAQAQTNPCNPCAPRPANPCAPLNPCAAANPCAPAPVVNPCAAAQPQAQPGSPCAAAAVTTAAANPYDVTQDWVQAPYGDAMPDLVKNYLRAAPYVGTGGVVAEQNYALLKELGFKTILNLNTAEEGAEAEEVAAKVAGLNHVFLPVATRAPSPEQVEQFAAVVNDPANYPILVHCQSSNRVGAAWALYRAANGVPPLIAIQEGRTVGLKPSREGAVRAQLGLPPL